MPPGTGDIQITLSQSACMSGAVIVTTPHALSLIDAAKGETHPLIFAFSLNSQRFHTFHIFVLDRSGHVRGTQSPHSCCGEQHTEHMSHHTHESFLVTILFC